MIIWGWGKVTRKVVGPVFQRSCNYCNSTEVWNLCVVRTWFTLFFIPIIPYKKEHCISCPECNSYIRLTNEEFEEIKLSITSQSNDIKQESVNDSLRYNGKTETQINFLKQMEEHKNEVN